MFKVVDACTTIRNSVKNVKERKIVSHAKKVNQIYNVTRTLVLLLLARRNRHCIWKLVGYKRFNQVRRISVLWLHDLTQNEGSRLVTRHRGSYNYRRFFIRCFFMSTRNQFYLVNDLITSKVWHS